MCPMRSNMKSKPSRIVSGVVVVSMLLTISAQLLLLDSSDNKSLVAPWIIIILGTVVLVWALCQLFRTRSSNKPL